MLSNGIRFEFIEKIFVVSRATLQCVNPGGHNRARKVDAGLP